MKPIDPDALAKAYAALDDCKSCFSATVATIRDTVAACTEKTNTVIALCDKAMAPLDASLAATVGECETANTPLVARCAEFRQLETAAGAGTAQREYDAAFAPLKARLRDAHLSYSAAAAPILAILDEMHYARKELSEIAAVGQPDTASDDGQ